jgi:CspA family cold shock protein
MSDPLSKGLSVKRTIERRGSALRVVVELDIREVFARLGRPDFREQMLGWFTEVVDQILDVAVHLTKDPERGVVKWFNDEKGYGFLTDEYGEDIFVHHSGIAGVGYKTLKPGQQVQFRRRQGKMTLEAIEVEAVAS